MSKNKPSLHFYHLMPAVLSATYQHNKLVFIWLIIMATVICAAPIFSIAYYDWYGWIFWICLFVAGSYNLYLGVHYYGVVKSMSWFHILPLIIFVTYSIERLVGVAKPQITSSNMILYLYALISTITMCICLLFDFYDTYIWYITKDQFVIRDSKTLKKMIDLNLLGSDVETKQWIRQKGQWMLSEDYNQWGLLKQLK
eukprot:367702_1